jgi:hypothetical protein
MSHTKLDALGEKGFALLKRYHKPIPPEEWQSLEYMDWKSGGDTRFAPIASALGEMECAGFWDHGKPDKDGIWTKNAERCPSLVQWTTEVGARFGRVRIIELQPSPSPQEMLRFLHIDDNNRLNPDGEGWVVRAWLELTDCPDSYMVVREDKDDPSTESRIHCPIGAQYIVDSQRLQHAVYHAGPGPRYALITSFESGPALERWIAAQRAEAPVSA